jgi:hypothetical protein
MYHLAGIAIVDFRTACVQVEALDFSKSYHQEVIQPAKLFEICSLVNSDILHFPVNIAYSSEY